MTALFTITENLYHQLPTEEVSAIEEAYEAELTQEEEPYPHTYRVGPESQRLVMGWLEGKEISLVYIKNRDKHRTVTVHYGEESTLPPGGSMRFYPKYPERIRLTSPGPCKVAVTLFPS